MQHAQADAVAKERRARLAVHREVEQAAGGGVGDRDHAHDALVGGVARGDARERVVREAEEPLVEDRRLLVGVEGEVEDPVLDEVLEEGLEPFLSDVQQRIEVVAARVTHSYLRHEPQAGRVVGVARAAMIMAAQQQQAQQPPLKPEEKKVADLNAEELAELIARRGNAFIKDIDRRLKGYNTK